MSEKKTLTRRGFIKSAAAGAGALAFMGLSTRETRASQPPRTWDKEADVIVVGSGPTGLPAAVAAVEKGARVILLEKNNEVGGNGIINGGILSLGGGTRIQKMRGVEDSADLMFEEGSDYRIRENRRSDPKILRAFCDYNLSTFNWLEQHGVQFQDNMLTFPGVKGIPRSHLISWDKPGPGWLYEYGPSPSSGAGLIRPLEAVAGRKGVKTLLKHRMTKIIREGCMAGRVLGVEVEAGGKSLYFKARKAVILGTGSWKGNKWLRTLFDPRFTGDLVASGEPFVKADGTGILAGLEAGAALVSDRAIDFHLFHRMFGTRYYRFPPGSSFGAPGLGRTGQLSRKEVADLIIVNRSGLRYVNEALPEKPASFYDASLAQEDHILWAIFDEAAVKRHGLNPRPPVVEKDLAFSAPTIDELAKLIGVPGDALTGTVHRYNTFVERGQDPDFGKPKRLLQHKIEHPPFYAVWISIQVHDTAGGLATNDKSQVLDIYGEVIPGLYAAGEVAGGLDKIGMARGIVMGRIAGENAA
ncbi:MAG: FAD-dependent oxidoreductase [Deltaproteobacteria bacterium]|nr:MAG: FAD-dependent oxidoreductase [Deltaproteobacteria bacterium]